MNISSRRILPIFLFAVTAFLLIPQPARAAAPTAFTSQTYQDSDGNGTVDQVVIVINGGEALTTCTVTDAEIGTDFTYTGNSIGGSLTNSGNQHTCNTASATITLKITGANANTTGHATAPTIAYDNDDADNSVANASGNLGAVGATNVADGAGPKITAVATNTASGKNTLQITYSEAIVVATDGGGDADLAGGGSTASTATLGAMTTVRTVAGIGGWNGSSNFVNNSATNNTVALNGGATVLTITFNGQSGSFFTAGSTAPSTDTFTPVADANDITDAANNAVSTATIAMTVTGAWDAAAPATTTIQNKGKTPSQLTMFWAPAGESDFDRYDLYYRTSSAVTYQNGALWSTSNDSALATVGTSESTVTGLLPGTAYYFIIYIIDYAGNLSPISNEYPISTSGTGGEAATDSTPPAVATDIVVSKIADGKVKITWKDPADKDLSEIYILRGDNGALVNAIPREKIVPGTQEFIDTTVKMGSTYTYVVRTLDVKGNAKDSEVFTIALAEEVAMPDEEPDTVDETGTLPDADTEGEEVIEVVDEEDTEDMDTEVEDLEDDEESDEEIQAAPLGPINDVPMGHWAEESIMAVREARLMLEKKAGEFRLEDKMTRAEAVMVIVRAIGGGSMVGELYDDAPFQDVPEDAWYAVAVHWAWKFSVIQGIEKFEPGKLVNRAEFFAMILRAQEIEIDEEKTTDHFADIPSGKWFDAVAAESFEREYLLGKPKGDLFYFAGEENITRGEAATILKKVFID